MPTKIFVAMADLRQIVIPYQISWKNAFVKLGKNAIDSNISNDHLMYLADRTHIRVSFPLPTSSEEMEREIKILIVRNSSGPDDIETEVLKLCP